MTNIKIYDIVIAYRIYPGVSKTPFIFPDNKLKLTEVGVRSLRYSLADITAKIFFLLDNCPVEYETMILKYFDPQNIEFLRFDGIGNLSTFGKQIDILLEQNDSDVVFFAEDDYVYRPGIFKSALLFVREKNVDFITPYDHLDSYRLPIHTQNKYEITIRNGIHWRTSASTCLTFLTTKETLFKTRKVFRSYCKGNWDSCLWFAITKFNIYNVKQFVKYLFTDTFLLKIILLSWIKTGRQVLFGKKYKLWQPIPSIATHMEYSDLAPNIEWKDVVLSNEKMNTEELYSRVNL